MSYSAVRGYGDASTYGVPGSPENPCPVGTHQTCLLGKPGQPVTADMCHCQTDSAAPLITQASSYSQYHWGLYLGLAAAAFVVYKVAT